MHTVKTIWKKYRLGEESLRQFTRRALNEAGVLNGRNRSIVAAWARSKRITGVKS